jgi:hypothetical protein
MGGIMRNVFATVVFFVLSVSSAWAPILEMVNPDERETRWTDYPRAFMVGIYDIGYYVQWVSQRFADSMDNKDASEYHRLGQKHFEFETELTLDNMSKAAQKRLKANFSDPEFYEHFGSSSMLKVGRATPTLTVTALPVVLLVLAGFRSKRRMRTVAREMLEIGAKAKGKSLPADKANVARLIDQYLAKYSSEVKAEIAKRDAAKANAVVELDDILGEEIESAAPRRLIGKQRTFPKTLVVEDSAQPLRRG